jgi:hypothetical protein
MGKKFMFFQVARIRGLNDAVTALQEASIAGRGRADGNGTGIKMRGRARRRSSIIRRLSGAGLNPSQVNSPTCGPNQTVILPAKYAAKILKFRTIFCTLFCALLLCGSLSVVLPSFLQRWLGISSTIVN